MKCIIVEDEPLAMEKLQGYVQKIPYLELMDSFTNGTDALIFLATHSIDLVFLDIHLGDMSGIKLLESTNTSARVIIISAFAEYALKGYELNITDYLLKPYTFERFLQCSEKAWSDFSKKEQTGYKEFIFVKTEYRLEKVLLSEILFIEGMRDYRRIHTATKSIMTLQTFKDLEKEIPTRQICRVHKSFMVNIGKIDSIEKEIIKIGKNSFPISESYKKTFFDLISHSDK